jgi:hypothetical protein
MEKVVPFFKTFTTIFCFKFFEFRKDLYWIGQSLKPFELCLNLNPNQIKPRRPGLCRMGPPVSNFLPTYFDWPLARSLHHPRPALSGCWRPITAAVTG